jgi:vancomycin resistance protein YoaR
MTTMKKMLALCTAIILLTGMMLAPVASADTDVSASTSLDSASSAQLNNIQLAVDALDGSYVAYGDTFSFNDVVGDRTPERGYKNAVNGRGVKAMGGGVAQVAATIYLALKQLDGIDYVEKKVYGSKFAGDYLDSGDDAVITDSSEGIDFVFENNYDDFYINIWTTDSSIECTLSSYNDPDYGDSVGSATIYLDGTDAMLHNIELAAGSVYDTTLESGDSFSFNSVVGPRTADYGYKSAVNGRGVKVMGGGVAQVASAIWLAIKDLDTVSVTEKHTYGSRYNQTYVDDPDDAILTDYDAGTDFCFTYDGDGELSIYTQVSGDTLVCEIYEN